MKSNAINWKKRKLFGGMFMLLMLFGLPFVIMYLWNAILPEVIHVASIGYWQALGLFILSRILFGGFHCGPRSGRKPSFGRAGFRQKFMKMTDEEKAAFKEKWKERCCKK